MCLDLELNKQPLGSWVNAQPLSSTSPKIYKYFNCSTILSKLGIVTLNFVGWLAFPSSLVMLNTFVYVYWSLIHLCVFLCVIVCLSFCHFKIIGFFFMLSIYEFFYKYIYYSHFPQYLACHSILLMIIFGE
uniref:Uncharacterized protein n=1 Tax=Pipistrellus kuhlii TaxID=59472 RepID=A0A7J7YWM6_PIPKU|nr:hypothetical protein mPipKuh1_009830 [Pipistrellus kuhlii]